ncbi:MAG TPA: DUF4422 domain-containing protein [Clostridia bacterium]|jgi:hypothetical protein|nr:DUF4422 domain-containing protein [Clostridia bacterium]
MEKSRIKIFVIGHKKAKVAESKYLIPLQAGTFDNGNIEGFLPDNVGENISDKNKFYCELTAQYYAWKNEDADYYGFFHYRRYLSFVEKDHSRPHTYYNKIDDKLVSKFKLDDLEKVVEGKDVLIPYPENMHITIREHYLMSPEHINKDALEHIMAIIVKKHPEMEEDIKYYLDENTFLISKNMYIMSKEFADGYFTFLFDILKEYDNTYGDEILPRTQGFLAERIFAIYFLHLKRTTDLKYAYLQRVDILEFSKNKLIYKLGYFFLPPGTKRRIFFKNLLSDKMFIKLKK